jgi:peptide/nickel transport system permease protein
VGELKYPLRILLQTAAQVAALSLLAFALSSSVPGDVLSEADVDPQLRGATLQSLRQRSQLDLPWPRRYGNWASGALHGDFGNSLAYNVPIGDLLLPRLPRTLLVAAPAWLGSWTLGLVLAFAALRGGIARWLDAVAAALQMIPEVILASLIAWPLLLYFRIDPTSIWLPLLPVVAALFPTVFLHAAGSLAGAAESRPVQLARLANLPPSRWFRLFLLPAAANPLLGLIGPTLVAAVGSTVAVEAVTGWPGIGTLFLEAFKSRDYPVTQAILLLLGSALAVVNALSDLLLFKLDPRIRHESR